MKTTNARNDSVANSFKKFMNYTDKQLKQALAKMLPSTVCYGNTNGFKPSSLCLAKMLPSTVCYGSPQGADGLYWRPRWNGALYRSVLDTELLHLCYLVEETLNEYKSAHYAELMRPVAEHYKLLYHATWQKRVVMLAEVKGIEI